MRDDLFRGHGIEIKLVDPKSGFLLIRETLTRIGVSSKRENKLYQSCHILHKQGRYAIVHFKEMFSLDGKQTDFSEEDKARRNKIAELLREWKLCTFVCPEEETQPRASLNQIKIIPHPEKKNWELIPKYQIGNKKRPE
jgi:hypothetical protein